MPSFQSIANQLSQAGQAFQEGRFGEELGREQAARQQQFAQFQQQANQQFQQAIPQFDPFRQPIRSAVSSLVSAAPEALGRIASFAKSDEPMMFDPEVVSIQEKVAAGGFDQLTDAERDTLIQAAAASARVVAMSGDLKAAKPDLVAIERFSKTKGKGKFWTDSGTGIKDFGDVKTEAFVDRSKLHQGDSSRNFLVDEGLWNKPDPALKKELGFDTLAEMEDGIAGSGGGNAKFKGNPNHYYRYMQKKAEHILKERGFAGAEWLAEDDLIPHQFQIWDDAAAVLSDLKVPKQQLAAISKYGETANPAESAFITNDGRMIDGSSKAARTSKFAGGTRIFDHRQIATGAMNEAGSGDELMRRFMKTGSIRTTIDPDQAFVEFANQPTSAQMKAIKDLAKTRIITADWSPGMDGMPIGSFEGSFQQFVKWLGGI